MHPAAGGSPGQIGGEEAHVLTMNEMPAHVHQVTAGSDFPANTAAGNFWGGDSLSNYSTQANTTMSPNALTTSGGSEAHANMQPYNVVNFCIATTGYFPSRN